MLEQTKLKRNYSVIFNIFLALLHHIATLRCEQEVLQYHINKVTEPQLYLWQVSDVHLHVAALTGPVQPLHVHIQRPETRRDI